MSHETDPTKGILKTTPLERKGVIFSASEIADKPLSRKEKLKNKLPFHRKTPIAKTVVDGLTIFATPDMQVHGKDNLETAVKIAKSNGLIFVACHKSNLDAPALERALSVAGHGEIVEKLIFLQGIKLDRNPFARLFLSAYHRIKVWPPDLTAKNSREKEQRLTMTRNSFDVSEEALEKGYFLAIFGEGGRSYNGQLKQAAPTIVRYLMLRPDTIVIPVAISGTQKVLPQKNFIPNPFGSQVSVSFGEYINIHSLINDEKFKNLPDSKRNKEIVDFIMKRIAIMLPEDERGVYA